MKDLVVSVAHFSTPSKKMIANIIGIFIMRNVESALTRASGQSIKSIETMRFLKANIIIGLLLSSLLMYGQSSQSVVIGIDHSDFVDEIYPNMERPAVFLFGSNYCRNSLNQFKMLRERASMYKGKVDFYSVNVDANENFEWLEQICTQEHLDALGTPTWVFYYAEEGYKYLYYAQAGGLYPADLSEIVEDMIERSKIGYDDDEDY